MERKLRDEESAHTTTIEQRDNAEHWADQLAEAIAERFGVDIGEHSNLNCPWNEALVWMQQPPTQAQHSVPEGLAEFSQFLSAVMDAAGLVRYGRRSKELSEYLGAQCMKYRLSAPVAQAGQVPQAWLDVQAERRRQITVEGFDTSNDDASAGLIALAAGCYALHAGGIGTDWPDGIRNGSALFWPWDEEWWKPKSARENLVRAGALVLAEIERLDRAAPGKEVGHE